MLLFSYDTATFARALRSSPPQLDLVIDTTLSLVLFLVFFVKQAATLRNLKRCLGRRSFEGPSQAGRGFGVLHIVLSAAFLFSVTAAVITCGMKLIVVRQAILSSGGGSVCPEGSTMLRFSPGMCVKKGWDDFARVIDVVDVCQDLLLQLLLLLSDGLMIYQCYVVIERPLVHLVTLATLLRLGSIPLIVFMSILDTYDSTRSAYASVTMTVIVLMTALIWLCWVQDGRISLESTAVLNTTKRRREASIQRVAKGLFYAVLLAIAHLGLSFRLKGMFISVNVTWFVSLIMASQNLALCFLKEDDELVDDLGLDAISLPNDDATNNLLLDSCSADQREGEANPAISLV